MSWALSHKRQSPNYGAYNVSDNLNLSVEVIIYPDLDDDCNPKHCTLTAQSAKALLFDV